MRNESIRYLIVPGWQGSPEDHWQSHWQNSLPNSARVEQADWLTPRREDWVGGAGRGHCRRQHARHPDRPQPWLHYRRALGGYRRRCSFCVRYVAPCWSRRRTSSARPARRRCAILRRFQPICCRFPARSSALTTTAAVSAPRALELARNWGAEAGILAGAGHINVKSGSSALGAGFCLSLSSAKPHGTPRPASRLNLLFLSTPPSSGGFGRESAMSF